jgi:shikimate kinase
MNIVLIGFMGSGKTVVAEKLSKKLKMEHIEMDELVLKKTGRKSINEIFDRDGETKFRELEIEVAKELSGKNNVVISTGGGIVFNKIILDYLRENGFVVSLRVSFAEAKRRLEKFHDRPLFRDIRMARKLYFFRKPLYREYSDVSVRTDGKTIEQVTNAILDLIEEEA